MTLIKEETQEAYEHVEPRCAIFGTCGGCAYQSMAYADELRLKENAIKDRLSSSVELGPGIFAPIVASPKPYHYRHRIDLKLQRTREGIIIGYTPHTGRGIINVDTCPIAAEPINDAIASIKQEALGKLTEKYTQANLTIRAGQDGRVRWGGIGRRSLRLAPEDYLSVTINGRQIFYSMETFFQANLSILPALIDVIRRLDIWGRSTHFYDLYGGVGLFAVSLADLTQETVLIEQNAESVKLARFNKEHLQLSNLKVLEGRVEDQWTETFIGGAPENRVAMIDPPRSGLSPSARELFANSREFDHLLYLSCNAEALADDLKAFVAHNWRINRIVPFDFFPKTRHVETLVVLEKTDGKK